MIKRGSPHYHWFICAAGAMMIFVSMGMVSNGFSIYLPYIQDEIGLTHTQTSSLVTLRCLVSFVSMLLIGFYYNKLSLRTGMGIAATCAGIAFFIYSFANHYLTFCLGAAISGLSYGLGSMIPVSILMSHWFMKRRALAVSICAAGSSISTIALPPVTAILIRKISMSAAFRLESMMIFAITLLVVLVVRNKPSEKHLRPYGQEHVHAQKLSKNTVPLTSFSLTPKGWILMTFVSLCMGALANPGFSHLPVLYASEHFAPMTVAMVMSASGIIITFGKIFYGYTTDRIGGSKSSLVFGLILLVGHVLCCLAFLRSLPLVSVNILCLGIGYPIATIGPTVWAGDMSSPDKYPAVLRRLQVTYAGGALLFANIPGILADLFNGSYIPAYLLFSVLLAATLFFIALAYREAQKNAEPRVLSLDSAKERKG